MAGRYSQISVVAVITTAIAVAVVGPMRAAPSAQNPDTLAALLVEVKGLRAAIEQMAATGPRVQLAFGRLQIHEQRVGGLVRRLDVVREKSRSMADQEAEIRERLTAFEGMLKRARTADEQRDGEAAVAEARKLATRAAYDLQQLQAEEAALTSDIAAEQARWLQINQQLEELERSLSRR